MLNLYRRHTVTCPHREKGQTYRKCACPIWVRGHLQNRPLRRALKTRNWEAAEREIERWMEKPKEREQELRTGVPITKAIEKYLAALKLKGRAEATLRGYSILLEHFRKFSEARSLASTGALRLTDFDDFQMSRLEETPSLKTRRKEVEYLRAFCGFCVKREWMLKNYAKDLEAPGDQEMPTLPFEKEEIYRLLAGSDEIDNPNERYVDYARKRMRAMILTLCYTGLRISDAVQLDRSRLLANGVLRLRQKKTGGWITTKLHADAVAALKAIPPHPDVAALSPYFFWNGRCKLSTVIGSLRRSMASLGRITGINVHPHRFRDTFAVELLETGEDIRTVQLLLGHTSLRTTEKHYAHFVTSTQERLHRAVEKLDFSQREATTGQVIPFPAH